MAKTSEDFQKNVAVLIARNTNVLDILTKYQESCSRIFRSTVKSATGCGCISICAEKVIFDIEDFSKLPPKDMAGTRGKLCCDCKSHIENEIGEALFYLASLCNALELSMKDIMKHEINKVETLGKYSLR